MKSDTRNVIISTASELFYNKGYNLTGINEIIDKAGIAKATLYSHFKSKEELCLAYLDARDAELIDNIKLFCKEKPKGNKRLIAVLEFLLPFLQESNFNGCWCIRTIAEIPKDNKKIRAKIKFNKLKVLDFVRDLVKENKSKFSSKKQELLAKRIYLLYEGAITESHLQQDVWPINTNIELLKSLL